jgi:hypothetical protein
MPATYEPIATTTLSSAASSITFNSISGSYTDLRLIIVLLNSSNNQDGKLTFNNDTATNYSGTHLYGDGTSAGSYRETSVAYIPIFSLSNIVSSGASMAQIDIFSYAGGTNKTVLIQTSNDKNGSGSVARSVGLWRSTSAITRLDLALTAGTYNSGTTATLYGILKA